MSYETLRGENAKALKLRMTPCLHFDQMQTHWKPRIRWFSMPNGPEKKIDALPVMTDSILRSL